MIKGRRFGREAFTLLDAVRLAKAYSKRRFERVVINIAPIALANSFLTSHMLTDTSTRYAREHIDQALR